MTLMNQGEADIEISSSGHFEPVRDMVEAGCLTSRPVKVRIYINSINTKNGVEG